MCQIRKCVVYASSHFKNYKLRSFDWPIGIFEVSQIGLEHTVCSKKIIYEKKKYCYYEKGCVYIKEGQVLVFCRPKM